MSNRPKNVRRMNYTILPPKRPKKRRSMLRKKPKQRRSMLRMIKEQALATAMAIGLTNENKFGKEEFYD